MTPRQSTVFLLWAGGKQEAGHPLTDEEAIMFSEARQVSIMLASRLMRIKPREYEYVPGQEFS